MAMASQMITANRLSDGMVVYFTAGKGWSETFAQGVVRTHTVITLTSYKDTPALPLRF